MDYFFSSERCGDTVVVPSFGETIDFTYLPEIQHSCSPIQVFISDDVIHSSSRYGFVNELKFAKTLMAMAHEARHVYQFSHMYQQPNTDMYMDMFRLTAISSTFLGYYRYMCHFFTRRN